MSRPEKQYCVTRKELLAIVHSTQHFHPYLYGAKFLLHTDHAALHWLLNFHSPEGQIAHWLERLQEHGFPIEHRAGSKHSNADALSRQPCLQNACRHCDRQESKGYSSKEDIFESSSKDLHQIIDIPTVSVASLVPLDGQLTPGSI